MHQDVPFYEVTRVIPYAACIDNMLLFCTIASKESVSS